MNLELLPNVVDLDMSQTESNVGSFGIHAFEERNIRNSLDAFFLVQNFFIWTSSLSEHVFVWEIWSLGDDWLLGNPNMSLSPYKTVLYILIGAKLWNVSKYKQIFTWNGLILDLKNDTIILTWSSVFLRTAVRCSFWTSSVKIERSVNMASHGRSTWLLDDLELWWVVWWDLRESTNLIEISIDWWMITSTVRAIFFSFRWTSVSSDLESVSSLFS